MLAFIASFVFWCASCSLNESHSDTEAQGEALRTLIVGAATDIEPESFWWSLIRDVNTGGPPIDPYALVHSPNPPAQADREERADCELVTLAVWRSLQAKRLVERVDIGSHWVREALRNATERFSHSNACAHPALARIWDRILAAELTNANVETFLRHSRGPFYSVDALISDLAAHGGNMGAISISRDSDDHRYLGSSLHAFNYVIKNGVIFFLDAQYHTFWTKVGLETLYRRTLAYRSDTPINYLPETPGDVGYPIEDLVPEAALREHPWALLP